MVAATWGYELFPKVPNKKKEKVEKK